MDPLRRLQEEAELKRLSKCKSTQRRPPATLADDLVHFYQTEVKRAKKLCSFGEAWKQALPPHLLEHTCIDSFRAGTITVLVDSSPHLFQLRQLLLAGLQAHILSTCRNSGVRKIMLKPGTWYAGDKPEDRQILFPRK
jgi:hypothetical protein